MKQIKFNKISKQIAAIAIISLALLGLIILWQSDPSEPLNYLLENKDIYSENIEAAVRPIPPKIQLDPQKIELGERLFYEVELSKNKTISCASCHNLKTGGTDGKKLAIGIDGVVGVFNTPTVFNSGFNDKQFWDGRAKNLEELIEETIYSPNEMRSNWQTIMERLNRLSGYRSQFKKIYRAPITSENIKEVIATYLRSLSTPNSRFDRFLRGDKTAINAREKAGYFRFQELGCITCHQGINLGSNMFQPFGVMLDYLAERGELNEIEDKTILQEENKDKKRLFKVPTLRNIALTAPYFHNGSAATLEESITIMGKIELGQKLSSEDINLIVDFLKTLTGEYRGKML